MSTHTRHPPPDERPEFLVDGCPRCLEYVTNLGLSFDPLRYREFWAKMIEVEYDAAGGYASSLDKALGTELYKVALGLQRGFGLDPRLFEAWAMSPLMILVPPAGDPS